MAQSDDRPTVRMTLTVGQAKIMRVLLASGLYGRSLPDVAKRPIDHDLEPYVEMARIKLVPRVDR